MAYLGTLAEAAEEDAAEAAGAAGTVAGGLVLDEADDAVAGYYAAGFGASGFLGGAFTYLIV